MTEPLTRIHSGPVVSDDCGTLVRGATDAWSAPMSLPDNGRAWPSKSDMT